MENQEPVKKNQDIVVTYDELINYKNIDEGYPKELFEDVIGHQVGQHWVAIFTKEGNTKIIPSSRIREINVIIKE